MLQHLSGDCLCNEYYAAQWLSYYLGRSMMERLLWLQNHLASSGAKVRCVKCISNAVECKC